MELILRNIDKSYGSNHALDCFSHTFSEGVYGLLGPNGTGKSTLMNIISDNLVADKGEILYNGSPTRQLGREFRRILGVMPQQQGIYPNFTLRRFLWYMAALKAIKREEARKQIDFVMERLNLASVADRKLGAFSGGMKQRALIAQAMLGEPEILILDEPTAGLDPKERIRIRNLIAELAMDRIVIIATHVVTDIEFIAREILLLKKGVLQCAGTAPELCAGIEGEVYQATVSMQAYGELEKHYLIGNMRQAADGISVRFLSGEPVTGYPCETARPTLEDVYLSYFGNE